MKFLIITSHFFSPGYRKAGMHHFALALARNGHEVDFMTVGQSYLKQLLHADARRHAQESRRNPSVAPGLTAHVHGEIVHPVSGRSNLARFATKPLLALYGNRLDRAFRHAAQQADVLILECGYPLFFFRRLKKVAPEATFVAFYNDRLDVVGFRREVIALHERLMPRFDLVRTNAERLLNYLPDGVNGEYVPQGVDKAQLDLDCASPYPLGTRNIVSVGNMLFDDRTVRTVARAAKEQGAFVHVIGAKLQDPPDNAIVYGEMPFERTLPYVKHADAGLAPYREAGGIDYLVQSSLKLQQYTYFGLPILIPEALAFGRNNVVGYDPDSDKSIHDAVTAVLGTEKNPALRSEVHDWDEVIALLLGAISRSGARFSPESGRAPVPAEVSA